jgi:hypothetical protein
MADKANMDHRLEVLVAMVAKSFQALVGRSNPMNENEMFHAKNQADPSTLREFERAVPNSVATAIAEDHRGKPTSLPMSGVSSSGLPNYSEPTPLGPPPGIALMDKMMEVENALWRRELAQRLGVKAPNDEPPSDAAE